MQSFVAFVVRLASNAWLKSIFGYGEIATDISFQLAGAVLFLAYRFNRRAANLRSNLSGSARSGTGPTCGSWKRTGIF